MEILWTFYNKSYKRSTTFCNNLRLHKRKLRFRMSYARLSKRQNKPEAKSNRLNVPYVLDVLFRKSQLRYTNEVHESGYIYCCPAKTKREKIFYERWQYARDEKLREL